jgi:site-specific DNA-methyltransferase (adenine-specific)
MLELNKIYNMDCREGLKQLPNNFIDLTITSPPYNVGIKYDIWNDCLSWKDYMNFTKEWLAEVYRVLKEDGRIALNILYEANLKNRGGRILMLSEFYQVMKEIGFKFAGLVDLKEEHPHRVKFTSWGSWLSPSAPYIYNPKECVLLMYKNQWKKINSGKSYFTNSEEHKNEFKELVFAQWKYNAETKKLTQANFSLDIPLKALKILSYENDIVLDPFMGSGTTAVACKLLNRNFIGFEISSKYCEIAEERIKNTLANINNKYCEVKF